MLEITETFHCPITLVFGRARFRYHYLGQQLAMAQVFYVDFERHPLKITQMKQRLLIEQQFQSDVAIAVATAVILDGCDGLSSDTVRQFIQETLADAQHIILFYTHFPEDWATTMGGYPQIQVISENPVIPDILPHTGRAGIPIKVEALRRGHVYLSPSVRIEDWRGQLQRDVFYFFIEHKVVALDTILETFWSHLPRNKAANNFFVTLGKLTKVLGFKPIMRTAGRKYALIPEIALQYDVDDFRHALQAANESADDEKITLLEQAVSLYRMSFLEGLTNPWVMQRRQELVAMAVEALWLLAQHYWTQQAWVKALGCLTRAFHIDSSHESITLYLMQLYLNIALPCDALTIYHHWLAASTAQPGKLPGAEIQSLAAQAQQACRASTSP